MLERVWRKGNFCMVGRNVTVQSLRRTVRSFLKKLKVKLPYDPTVPLMGIHLEEIIIWKYTHTPVFTAALFTIAKMWEQPKCPLTEEGIKKMVHRYNWSITQPEKELNNAICSNMDGFRDDHTKQSKPDKDKYHMITLTCEIFKKMT